LRALSDVTLKSRVTYGDRDIRSAKLIDLDQSCGTRMAFDAFSAEEVDMKKISIRRALLATAVFAFGTLGSVTWSPSNGLSLSIESAEARVGRPLTPVSVAGVARRTTRRAVVGGAAVGAAAAGTACVRVLVNGSYVCR
jgi:hypothetical protein